MKADKLIREETARSFRPRILMCNPIYSLFECLPWLGLDVACSVHDVQSGVNSDLLIERLCNMHASVFVGTNEIEEYLPLKDMLNGDGTIHRYSWSVPILKTTSILELVVPCLIRFVKRFKIVDLVICKPCVVRMCHGVLLQSHTLSISSFVGYWYD